MENGRWSPAPAARWVRPSHNASRATVRQLARDMGYEAATALFEQLGGSEEHEREPFETELMSGVASLRVAYWQRTGVWAASWHETDLPLLIRFQLIFAGEDAPRWPAIIVAPLLSRP